MVGRIYVGNHYALLHTKYRSCGPPVFKSFSIINQWKLYVAMENQSSIKSAQNLMQLLTLPDGD